MNLKKLITILILLPFLSSGCATLPQTQIETNVTYDLWNEIVKIVELKGANSRPNIFLRKKDTYKESLEDCSRYDNKNDRKKCREDNKNLRNSPLGRAFLGENRIEIYTETVSWGFSWFQFKHNTWLNDGVKKIYFYNIVAHEMLHHALWKKGVRGNLKEYQDTLEHHRLMRDKKYLESAILYLCQRFNLDPKLVLNELKLADLEYSIQRDNLTKERNKREKSAGKN